ncbi:hypothetical protein N9O66_03960 [Alphaproteobacteria bacterium]|jgi:hypothetical protein|nr:hypothetical protein [Alphaproteobacteria bacterium]MDA9805674.1 hypothetical protein [Alphaproteobacteria bacterium]MDB2584517.1 hypothetical protein [Alphaproteobacteria bacterium]
MKKIFLFIILSVFISFRVFSFEPYSGISCQNFNTQKKDEFFFKQDQDYIYATAYKRVDGEFIKVGNVLGQKVSSFILFEDNTVDENLNFAWHLDMVTKILKPFKLTTLRELDLKLPQSLDCISKNFWF